MPETEPWKDKVLKFDLDHLAKACRNVAATLDRAGAERDKVLRLRSFAAEVADWSDEITTDWPA